MAGIQHILIIDSPQSGHESPVGEILRAHGYATHHADHTTLPSDWANAFDLLLIYHTPPALDAFELLAVLNRSGETIPPVILLASKLHNELLLKAIRAQISDCIHFPLDYEELMGALKRTAQQKQIRQVRIERLLQRASDGLLLVDIDGKIVVCNDSVREWFDLTRHPSVIGLPAAELIEHPMLLTLYSQPSTASDTSRRTELQLEVPNITLNAQVTTVPALGHIIVLQDITHLKELDRIKSEFVERVSRDIRSPLTTIQGYVELIERMGPVNDQQKQFINRISFAVQSITALLSDLLELGRIEAGFETDREPTHFAMVLRYALEGAQQTLADKRIQLNVSLPEETSTIMGNPLRLRQMVDNLLDNAIKFTAQQGAINVSLSVQDTFLVLQIADNGIGIPSEDQPHVFEKFYRASNTRDRYKGAGLGLSIVKGIVDKHNGRIWLESHENEGTSFTIMLPIQSVR